MPKDQPMTYQNGGGGVHEVSVKNNDYDSEMNEKLLHQSLQPHKVEEQQQHDEKTKEGIILLFVSAFLFSFMGMFLQFTGRLGE